MPDNIREKDNARCREYYRTHRLQVLERQAKKTKKYHQTQSCKVSRLASYYRMVRKYPEKYRARYLLKSAIKAGWITKGYCEVCGATKVESHHDDYSKPLEVRWLCHQHHCELEGRWIPRN